MVRAFRPRQNQPVADGNDMRQSIIDLQQQMAVITASLQALNVQQPAPPARNRRVVVNDSDDENPFAEHAAIQEAHNEVDLRWESNFKLQIPEFFGSADAEDLLD